MTSMQLMGKFGVKFDDHGVTKQVDKVYDTDKEAATVALSLYAANPNLRDVRVVSANELDLTNISDMPPTQDGHPPIVDTDTDAVVE